MNIFVLSKCPHRAAIALVDKHVVKMILESVQLLSTAFIFVVPENERENIPHYKKAHMNHPCAVWARERRMNFMWLGLLALAISKEYTYRYKKVHKSEQYIRPMMRKIIDMNENELQFTIDNSFAPIKNFPLAMPQDIRRDATRATPQVAVHMYKKYYKTKCENKWAVWAKGRPPLFNFA